MRMRYLLIAGAAALALGLAGCGSSDDDTAADDTPTVEEPTGPTQAELDAAQAAAKAAQAEADAAKQALADKEAADAAAAATLAGRQLHAVMTGTPIANLVTIAADAGASPPDLGTPSLSSSGLRLAIPDGTDLDTLPDRLPVMKAGDSVGSLNGWEGSMYAHRAGLRTNDAHVYTYKKGPPGKPAAEAFDADSFAHEYSAADRLVTFAADVASRSFKSDSFPTGGNTAYDADDNDAIAFEGTLNGVPGRYRCDPGADSCSATVTTGGIELTDGTWTFLHDAGGTTVAPDANYQYFGWWLQKFAGRPVGAGAFFGTVGSGNTPVDVGEATFRGTATYSGSAAGKWAHDDPLAGTGDAGHFTADVSLSAKFGNDAAPGDASGISGSLSNFMANEQEVPWAVTLRQASWGTPGDSTSGTFIRDGGVGTIWAIDGNRSDMSGSWNGRVYDDAAGDNSNAPTVAVGVFHSEFGSTHRMVGGFGATKD